MKALFDLFPVILFFITYKLGMSHPEQTAGLANETVGWLVAGGVVRDSQAPILLATVATIAATLLQIVYLMSRKRKVEPMLWASLTIITVLGGATVYLQNDAFLKWKPTVLYWVFSATLAVSALFFRKNLIRSMMGAKINLPDAVWTQLNAAWAIFFAAMGVVNLYVAHHFSTDTWVNFKLFGASGAMLVFIIAQSLWMARYVKEEA